MSPHGKIYTKESSGMQWFNGDRYASVKIANPESGLWKTRVEGVSVSQAKELYNLEVNGESPFRISVEDHTQILGPVIFEIVDVSRAIDLASLTSQIFVTTPKGEKKDAGGSFSGGRFVFQPLDGKGNYSFQMSLKGRTRLGDDFQRQYEKTVLIGDYMPAFIGRVERQVGSYIIANVGSRVSNRPGLRCYVYPVNASKDSRTAIGVVTNVKAEECTIEIQRYFGVTKISQGDVVELDLIGWMNDVK